MNTVKTVMATLNARFARLSEPVQFLVAGSLVGAILGAALATLIVFGQTLAIGWQATWQLYGNRLIQLPLWGLLLGPYSAAGPAADRELLLLRAQLGQKAKHVWWRVVLIVYMVGVLVPVAASVIWMESSEYYRRLASAADPATSLLRQRNALSDLSQNAQRLLADLDTTQVQIQTAKRQLTETLVTVERQQKAVESSNTTLTDIQQQQAMVTDQLSRLQQALGGQQPITRADLDHQWYVGLLQGIVTSVIGSILFTVGLRIWSWRRST
jgi:hypothetical protein